MAKADVQLSFEELQHLLYCVDFTEGGIPNLDKLTEEVREDLRFKLRKGLEDLGMWGLVKKYKK